MNSQIQHIVHMLSLLSKCDTIKHKRCHIFEFILPDNNNFRITGKLFVGGNNGKILKTIFFRRRIRRF